MATRFAMIVVVLMVANGCAIGDQRIESAVARSVASRPEDSAAPFAQLVRVEKVRLGEPMEFVVDGAPRREADVILLALRVADPFRFEPRGDIGEVFVVGGVVARRLVTPNFTSVLVIAVPTATPQPPDAVWLAREATDLARRDQALLLTLRRTADRRGPAVVLPLPPPVIETFRAAEASRFFASTRELAYHVDELSKESAAK